MNLLEIQKLIDAEESTGRKIVFIDASSLKETGCIRRWYWNVVKGFKTSIDSQPKLSIEYGTAYHKFLELWYLGTAFNLAQQSAIDYYQKILAINPFALESEYEFRTLSHLIKSIGLYAENYPKENDSILATATEQKFAIPIWRNSRFTLLLCGTIDLVGTFANVPAIVDHKTSSPWKQDDKSLEAFFKEYEMSIQTMLYSWIHNKLYGWEDDRYISVVMNGIFTKGVTVKASKAGQFDGLKLKRSKIINYTREQMQFFEGWLNSKLSVIKVYLDEASDEVIERQFTENYDMTACRGQWGLCKYFDICKQGNNTAVRDSILKSRFKEIKYNPLTFGGGNGETI